jgi:chromosome segregation ATPase
MTKMVGTHASLKASKKSLEKEIELKFADFANKLNASLQNQDMFSGAIQQGSFNIQQLMMMLQQNVSEKQALESQIEELNQTVTILTDESEVQREILEEQDLRIEELSSEIGLKDDEIEHLKEILSVDDTSAEESALHKDEIDMLEKQIQALSQSQLDTHKGESANMISNLEEMSKSIKNNEQNIHSKYTELIKEFIALTKSYYDLKEELQTKNKEIQENQATIVEKERENAELKREIRQIVLKVKEISNSKVQNEDAIAALKIDILSHSETIEQNKADIKGLQSDNDELYAENSENSTKLISQNEEIQKLTDDFNKQTEELSGSQDERAELVEVNEALKSENELLKTENDKLNEIHEKYNEIMQKKKEADAEDARKLKEHQQELEEEKRELEEEHKAWEEGRINTGKKRMKNIRRQINPNPKNTSLINSLNQGLKKTKKNIQNAKTKEYKALKNSHNINTQIRALYGKKPRKAPSNTYKKGSPLKPETNEEKRDKDKQQVLKDFKILGLTRNNVSNLN